MKRKKYDPYIASIWGSMANYMEFCQEWAMTCVTVNKSVDNPNRALARRWNVR